MRGSYRIGLAGLVLLPALASAQNYTLPKSSVESYRSESHYGVDEPLLNPLFPLEGKFELTLGAAYSPFSNINNYGAGWVGLNVHFAQRHALDLWGAYAFASGVTRFVSTDVAGTPGANTTDLRVDAPRFLTALNYLYSPYYSKMHITPTSVAHFNIYFGLGPAYVRTQEINFDGTKGAQANRFGLSATAGIRFMVPSRWTFKFELRDFLHGARQFGKTVTANTLQMSIGFGLFFGSFPDNG